MYLFVSRMGFSFKSEGMYNFRKLYIVNYVFECDGLDFLDLEAFTVYLQFFFVVVNQKTNSFYSDYKHIFYLAKALLKFILILVNLVVIYKLNLYMIKDILHFYL